MIQSVLNKSIEKEIGKLIDEFKKHPDKFLTEADVRSYLYHLLLEDFGKIEATKDGEKSIPLHCEVRWYGSDASLNLRSDIVVIDVSTLKVKGSRIFRLPSKAYAFEKPNAVIEIKLRRKKYSWTNRTFPKVIEKEREKLKILRQKIGHKFCSYILILDKKKLKFIPIEREYHKEYYVSAS